MSKTLVVKLYGVNDCHKTSFYQKLLNAREIQYQFLDVRINNDFAEELRSLYENKKLNFPTITIGQKKLRNPKEKELIKWIDKLITNV
jgi:glutaredoxin